MLDESVLPGWTGREDLFIGMISTGAMNDLERVTKQAYRYDRLLGMSDKLPNLCYYNNDEYRLINPIAKNIRLIDDEVKLMGNQQYERALKDPFRI